MVRYSGTELLARVMLEGENEKKIRAMARGYRRSDSCGGWQVVMIRLGVNVDHVATVRQARRVDVPDPVAAALLAEKAGADGITVHLREDRRHIQERDVERLREQAATKINLEMAVTPAMVAYAEKIRPHDACFVPEKREELTTEGGLDVVAHKIKVKDAVKKLQDRGIHVSLFIDPAQAQIETARKSVPTRSRFTPALIATSPRQRDSASW